MIIKLLVEAGDAKPGPALSQQLGPLGINVGKLLADVNKASESYRGMKVPAIVDIDPEKKTFTVEIRTPPTSELIKKELGLDKGAKDSKIKVGNLAMEQAVKITMEKEADLLANNFKNAVKNVIATGTSMGILIEGKEPKVVSKEIDQGMYDNIIDNKITEINEEKQKVLDEQYVEIKAIIEKTQKAEEAAKKIEEEKAAKKAETAEVKEGEGEEAKTEGTADAATAKTPATEVKAKK